MCLDAVGLHCMYICSEIDCGDNLGFVRRGTPLLCGRHIDHRLCLTNIVGALQHRWHGASGNVCRTTIFQVRPNPWQNTMMDAPSTTSTDEALLELQRCIHDRNVATAGIYRLCAQIESQLDAQSCVLRVALNKLTAQAGVLRAALSGISGDTLPDAVANTLAARADVVASQPQALSMLAEASTLPETAAHAAAHTAAHATAHAAGSVDETRVVAGDERGYYSCEWSEVAEFQKMNFGCWPAGRYGNTRLRAWVARMRTRIASGHEPMSDAVRGVSVAFPVTDEEVADNKLVLALHNALALCATVANVKREPEPFDGDNEKHRSVAMNSLLRLGGTVACNIVHDIVACRFDPAATPRESRLKQRFKEVLAHYGYFGRSATTGHKRKRPYRWDVVPAAATAVRS